MLEEPIFQEAIRNAHIRLFERWNSADTVEAREAIYAERRGLDAFLGGIREIVDEGAVEYHNRGGDVRDTEWSNFPGQDD